MKFSRRGDRASNQKSYYSYYSQWRSARKGGRNRVCQRIGVVRHSEAPRRYTSNTENDVAIVVPGLSTGSSSSSTSASSTSFLQDVGEPTVRPATTRSQSGSRGAQGGLWRFRNTKNKNKHEDMLEGWKELSHDILRGCRLQQVIK